MDYRLIESNKIMTPKQKIITGVDIILMKQELETAFSFGWRVYSITVDPSTGYWIAILQATQEV